MDWETIASAFVMNTIRMTVRARVRRLRKAIVTRRGCMGVDVTCFREVCCGFLCRSTYVQGCFVWSQKYFMLDVSLGKRR